MPKRRDDVELTDANFIPYDPEQVPRDPRASMAPIRALGVGLLKLGWSLLLVALALGFLYVVILLEARAGILPEVLRQFVTSTSR